ncbi:hypothetical protein [Ktedonobacter sp. SOSP1-52]|uniref:hypothetical protein n=1 Tax=Ktedonobacter sp. SOSP1-52 TaxID=2778366 RepID=UPI001915912E|nr:hypothetical protein [Ktedonobacter sp. SOSP1-52]
MPILPVRGYPGNASYWRQVKQKPPATEEKINSHRRPIYRAQGDLSPEYWLAHNSP